MEWYEDPVRARDAIRAATWRGAFQTLGLLIVLLLLVGILFPFFTQIKYSGPGMGPRRIALAIQRSREKTGQWAERFAPIRPEIGWFHRWDLIESLF